VKYTSKRRRKKHDNVYVWSLATCKMNCEKMIIDDRVIENSIPIQPLTFNHMEVLHTLVVASPLINHHPSKDAVLS
jgi:hypothetical protein